MKNPDANKYDAMAAKLIKRIDTPTEDFNDDLVYNRRTGIYELRTPRQRRELFRAATNAGYYSQ